jgi:hypothetical protein
MFIFTKGGKGSFIFKLDFFVNGVTTKYGRFPILQRPLKRLRQIIVKLTATSSKDEKSETA